MAYIKNVNYVRIVGKIGFPPKVTDYKGGARCVSLKVVTEEPYKDEEGKWQKRAEWHNVTIWNDSEADSLMKGDFVDIEGKLRTSRYTGNDGVDKYITSIYAKKVSRVNEVSQSDGGVPGDMPPYEDQPY